MNPRPRSLLSFSEIKGSKIVNSSHENLGKIEDFVINTDSGEVTYVILSFGGFLGIRNKLFALPWTALEIDQIENQFVLDISKEQLEKAPGFGKSSWPDFANPQFQTDVQDYYAQRRPFGAQHLR